MAEIDYAAVFAAAPSPYLLLDPDLRIVDVNQAYLHATGRSRDELIGRRYSEAFPDDASEAESPVRTLEAALRVVLASGRPDMSVLRRYDFPVEGRPGDVEQRWRSPTITPILESEGDSEGDSEGKVALLLLREEDVTAYVRAGDSGTRPPEPESPDRDAVRGELYMRARELERVNEELQQAHTREQQVAITLQEAMLAAPDLERHSNIAVRYLPAARSLHVCGDWYDLIDLDDNRFMVTVGDVVGYGLKAAAVMGILRSALSAANRALQRPQAALEVMGRHVQSFEDAVNTTAVTALVDRQNRVITYSSAGHPPPILQHADGSCELLDRATDPPLGARPDPAVPRPQANLDYRPGDTLLLYTDGLIERRDEDIDVGLNRLLDILGENTGLSSDELADTVLDRLGVSDGTDDDIALITISL